MSAEGPRPGAFVGERVNRAHLGLSNTYTMVWAECAWCGRGFWRDGRPCRAHRIYCGKRCGMLGRMELGRRQEFAAEMEEEREWVGVTERTADAGPV